MWISYALVAALLVAACAQDLHERRISNALNVAVWATGSLLQVALPGGTGLFDARSAGGTGAMAALSATALMGVAAMLLWRLRFFGGGDAKLLIALAPWVGFHVLPVLLAATLVCGGLLALAYLLRGSRAGTPAPGANPGTMSRAAGLPYSLAIAAGLGLSLGVTHLGWWGR